MSFIDATVVDWEPLVLPHSSRCRNPYHPGTVYRQPIWKGIGVPDVVIERRHHPIGRRAVRQIQHYVLLAQGWAIDQPRDYVITGVLGGFAFRPLERLDWLAYWQLDIDDDH